MGWASGGDLLFSIWLRIRKYIPEHRRVKVLTDLMTIFKHEDADTLHEMINDKYPEIEVSYNRLHND